MPKETWRKRLDTIIRISSAASLSLMACTPQESGEQVEEEKQQQGLYQVIDQTPSQLPITIDDQQSKEKIKTNPPQSPEREKTNQASVLGIWAELTPGGDVKISSPSSGSERIIQLPHVLQFSDGKVVFSPDGLKIAIAREYHTGTTLKSDAYLVWTQSEKRTSLFPTTIEKLDYTPLQISYSWSQDSKKLAMSAGQHGSGRTMVFAIDGDGLSFEGATSGLFSPDGNLFARPHVQRIDIFGFAGEFYRIPNASAHFNWSPDGRYIAFHDCSKWFDGPWGFICQQSSLSLYELSTKNIRQLVPSAPDYLPVFSKDGKKILFVQSANADAAKLAVVNIDSGKITQLNLPEKDFSEPNRYWWSWRFYDNATVIIVNKDKLYWVNIDSGKAIEQTFKTNRILEVFEKGILYQVLDDNGHRYLYLAPIIDQPGLVTGSLVGSLPDLQALNRGEDQLFKVIPDGQVFNSQGHNFIFKNGKRYRLEYPEIVDYLGKSETSVPEVLLLSIPESDTHLRFLPGDIIAGPNLEPWYLRNGQRYKINNWDEFAKKQRFNRGIHQELPQWVLDRMPIGQDQSADQAKRYGGVIDWDGALKEHQPNGGRMIIFVGGYGSTLTTQQEAFENIKRRLMAQGWSNKQFLEASYHVDQNTQIGGEVIPGSFTEEETRFHPLVSADKIALQINRYKVMFPKTKFILVGHSLGGFLAFNAALSHPDTIESVITLDSPLKGVDGSLIYNSPFSDQIVNLMGTVVGDYLVAQGNSQDFSVKVESDLRLLQTRGVKIFTFSSANDIMVTTPFAQLVGSDNIFEGQDIRLNWDFGLIPSEASLEEIYARHGDVLRREDFLNQLVVLFPVS